MPLGTLDRSPPPFFRQGPSALTKLLVCAALALFLMVADTRLSLVAPLRAALATVLLPIQRALMWPVEIAANAGTYMQGLQQATQREASARAALAAMADKVSTSEALATENAELRRLLGLDPRMAPGRMAAEILFEARDAFSHKVVIDRGQHHGVQGGSPVVNADGVLGQVTRVYPLSSEVTLLVDKDAAIPVINRRTRQPAAAFGGVRGPDGLTMELRFLPANADLMPGDELLTGGLDGVYPPGLPVARVAAVERSAEGGFANVRLVPAARGDGVRHVLVLAPTGSLRLRAADAAASAAQAASAAAPAAPTRGPQR
ncbi:MAG: rod shape-determining protein MreC [Rubrivivax sp.]|nr:rod shape-determining protein MreC [Rubrivivax sp.]